MEHLLVPIRYLSVIFLSMEHLLVPVRYLKVILLSMEHLLVRIRCHLIVYSARGASLSTNTVSTVSVILLSIRQEEHLLVPIRYLSVILLSILRGARYKSTSGRVLTVLSPHARCKQVIYERVQVLWPFPTIGIPPSSGARISATYSVRLCQSVYKSDEAHCR